MSYRRVSHHLEYERLGAKVRYRGELRAVAVTQRFRFHRICERRCLAEDGVTLTVTSIQPLSTRASSCYSCSTSIISIIIIIIITITYRCSVRLIHINTHKIWTKSALGVWCYVVEVHGLRRRSLVARQTWLSANQAVRVPYSGASKFMIIYSFPNC